MAVTDLFSKRQRRLRGDVPDVYTYDRIPRPLKIQILHMLETLLGGESEFHKAWSTPSQIFTTIVKTLRLEYGKYHISSPEENDIYHELILFLKKEEDFELFLDAIELIVTTTNEYSGYQEAVADFVRELNSRFKEHCVGYEILNGEVIRIDSRFLHSQVVKPAIQFLNQDGFEGAQQEFIRGYEHFRHGRYKEALTEALKCVESTLRSICFLQAWNCKSSDTAKRLIVVCQDNGLFPSYYQSHLSALVSLMEGLVTLRNNEGAHGQGPAIKTIDSDIVAYALHMTAAVVVMLASLNEAKNK